MIKSLNIEIVDDPVLCTHVIASDSVHSLRRTPRLMATLCITSNILKASWIEESYKNGTLLNCNRFLLLNDELAEKKFSFLMKNTLREGNKRRVEGGVFAGMIVLLCLNVAGNRAPKENELRMMVECAGGKMALISEFSLSENVDTSNVLIITSNPPIPPNQISSKKFNLAVANGALAFPISWMFDSFMRQKVSCCYILSLGKFLHTFLSKTDDFIITRCMVFRSLGSKEVFDDRISLKEYEGISP